MFAKLSPTRTWSAPPRPNHEESPDARTLDPLAAVCLAAALPATASADTVVSVGDSAISGEAGRWAGNTNQAASKTDALGAGAYNDAGGAESTPGCHRSKSAEVHIGDGVKSVNLACSGARTYSRDQRRQVQAGPGLRLSGANKGQARSSRSSRRTDKNIKAVVVLIGANDYGFADIVETCVTNWLTSPSWWKNYCQDDSNMIAMFSASNITRSPTTSSGAFTQPQDGDDPRGLRRLPVRDPRPDLLRAAAAVRRHALPARPASRARPSAAAAAWNSDINWARNTVVDTLNTTIKNAVAGMANVQVLDMVGALYGRRLCENTVGVLEEKGVSTWQSPGAVDKTEWVHQIRTVTTHLPALPAAGGRAPELLGPARAAQLLPPGLQRRQPARRVLLARHRAERQGRAEHGAQLARDDPSAWLGAPGSSSVCEGCAGRSPAWLGSRVPPAARESTLHRCGGATVRDGDARAGPGAAERAEDRHRVPLVPGGGRRPGRRSSPSRAGPGYPSTGHARRVPRDLRAAAARRATCCWSTTAGRAGRR